MLCKEFQPDQRVPNEPCCVLGTLKSFDSLFQSTVLREQIFQALTTFKLRKDRLIPSAISLLAKDDVLELVSKLILNLVMELRVMRVERHLNGVRDNHLNLITFNTQGLSNRIFKSLKVDHITFTFRTEVQFLLCSLID